MPLLVKIIVLGALLLIVVSLGAAFVQFSKRNKAEDDTRMVKALTVRVALSVALFAFIMILSALGVITPNA